MFKFSLTSTVVFSLLALSTHARQAPSADLVLDASSEVIFDHAEAKKGKCKGKKGKGGEKGEKGERGEKGEKGDGEHKGKCKKKKKKKSSGDED